MNRKNAKKNGNGLTKKRIFEIIQIGKDSDKASRAFDFIIVALILVSIGLAVCYTFEEMAPYFTMFNIIETITIICFTIELGLRLWTAEYLYKKKTRVPAAIRYLLSFNGVIELLSIVPFFLPLAFPKGAIVFRMFRVFRILRLFQANRYSDALTTILIVIKRKRNQLLSSMLIIFVIMLMSSLVMYGFEHEAQPEVFRNAFSGIWWSTSTLLTVGYGDIYPITQGGQVASIFITFLGVGMVAIPTGILSAGFTEFMTEQREKKQRAKTLDYCPYCGENLPKP
ncbi:ion transporter [Ruminococcaceae bacterium OttesenSCG-928-D13]|nr:ion transporter [Ruminococcaceae bacterium OttesenSCG-928-D13]